jgi:hypothetical protein
MVQHSLNALPSERIPCDVRPDPEHHYRVGLMGRHGWAPKPACAAASTPLHSPPDLLFSSQRLGTETAIASRIHR